MQCDVSASACRSAAEASSYHHSGSATSRLAAATVHASTHRYLVGFASRVGSNRIKSVWNLAGISEVWTLSREVGMHIGLDDHRASSIRRSRSTIIDNGLYERGVLGVVHHGALEKRTHSAVWVMEAKGS